MIQNAQTPQPTTGNTFFKKSTIIWGIVGLIAIIFLVGGCTSYNGLVKQRENVNLAWQEVQSAYQRRFDLIPNLVNTVKGASKYEKEVLTGVTDARAGITPEQKKLVEEGDKLISQSKQLKNASNGPDAQGPSVEQIENLERALNIYVNAVREAYPDLKATAQYADLMKQLESTENGIKTERDKYSTAVRKYNVAISTFPRSIIAGMFGFDRKNGFTAEAEAQNAVEVNFE